MEMERKEIPYDTNLRNFLLNELYIYQQEERKNENF